MKRLVGDRSGTNTPDSCAVVAADGKPVRRSRAAAAAIAAAAESKFDKFPNFDNASPAEPSTPAAAARVGLAEARELHREGRDEEAVDILVEWLDGPVPSARDIELNDLRQAMVALGCWLCNTLATRHLHARRVARAFGYTTTCERWLGLRQASADDGSAEEMWARLRYDRALNAAELAQSSGDRNKAIELLRVCERLQSAVPSLPDPEAGHLCLAEILLQSGRPAEAATAAVRAMQLLRKQPVEDEERKVYGLLFALSLEQAALAALGTAASGPPPLRALRCLPDAEAAWALTKQSEEGATPGVEAARALLVEMRTVHGRLLQQASSAHSAAHSAARSQSAPWLPVPSTIVPTLASTAPASMQKHQKRPGTSPSKPHAGASGTEERVAAKAKSAAKRANHLHEEMRRLQSQMRESTSSAVLPEQLDPAERDLAASWGSSLAASDGFAAKPDKRAGSGGKSVNPGKRREHKNRAAEET